MQQVLYRSPAPVPITGAAVVAAKLDLGGAQDAVLFVDNPDLPATLLAPALTGEKNAKVLFTAKAAGPGGNSISVTYTAAANQALAVSVVAMAITVALACDAGGLPR